MANESTLSDFHRENGAVFAEYEGWLLPQHFGDAAAEYQLLRSAAGLIDLPQRALLQFTGPDRLSFLQGMLSNDLRRLNPFDGQYAAILTQQGKVITDVTVLCAMNSVYLDFWENLKEKVIAHFQRYLVADDVEIADRTAEYTFLSIQGPSAEMLLRKLLGNATLPTRPKQHAMIDIEGAAICIVRQDRGRDPAFDLILPRASAARVARILTEAARQFSAGWIGEEAQNVVRVENGTPRYGLDFNENNLLLEVGIDDAVSFTKGCYLGQEIVERIRSRGHVNKKLCGLLIDGSSPAAAGDPIYADGKVVGTITSSVLSFRLDRPVALGYLGKEHWDPGTTVSVQHNQSTIRATVTKVPFIGSS
ncbi:MAG TPA: aminomethyltransferase family protein [Candidatus Binatia bacterium]